MNYSNEWTQKEYLENKRTLEREGVEVVLIDTKTQKKRYR